MVAAKDKQQVVETPSKEKETEPFSSNVVRLSGRQWLAALGIFVLLLLLLPTLWCRVERLEPGPDYRIPFRLGNDYWLFSRLSRMEVGKKRVLLLGDSVVWGHYVSSTQTLSHYLNEQTHTERFANLGVDGIHPAALLGLVRYYGRAIRNERVLLQCNFLWMSSKRHDLQTEKEFAFNHPRLVPQFYPRIPCYKPDVSERLGIVFERSIPFFGWTRHLRILYFGGKSFPAWTLEHPYSVPLLGASFVLPSPDEPPSPKPVAKPWTEQGLKPYAADWVPLEQSFQWWCFRQTVELLQSRGNHVFVVVGPFNEHMLTPESRARYQQLKQKASQWLQSVHVPYAVPEPLPSPMYSDASHPLADGYRLLAQRLLQNRLFQQFIQP